jgi:hypothetical protein
MGLEARLSVWRKCCGLIFIEAVRWLSLCLLNLQPHLEDGTCESSCPEPEDSIVAPVVPLGFVFVKLVNEECTMSIGETQNHQQSSTIIGRPMSDSAHSSSIDGGKWLAMVG